MALPRSKHNIFDRGSISEAMEEAAEESRRHAERNQPRPRPEQNKKFTKWLSRKLYELYHGKKAYLPKEEKGDKE